MLKSFCDFCNLIFRCGNTRTQLCFRTIDELLDLAFRQGYCLFVLVFHQIKLGCQISLMLRSRSDIIKKLLVVTVSFSIVF
jgi:hypothetical protein